MVQVRTRRGALSPTDATRRARTFASTRRNDPPPPGSARAGGAIAAGPTRSRWPHSGCPARVPGRPGRAPGRACCCALRPPPSTRRDSARFGTSLLRWLSTFGAPSRSRRGRMRHSDSAPTAGIAARASIPPPSSRPMTRMTNMMSRMVNRGRRNRIAESSSEVGCSPSAGLVARARIGARRAPYQTPELILSHSDSAAERGLSSTSSNAPISAGSGAGLAAGRTRPASQRLVSVAATAIQPTFSKLRIV